MKNDTNKIASSPPLFSRQKPERHDQAMYFRLSKTHQRMIDELVKQYHVSRGFVVRYGIEKTYAENALTKTHKATPR